MPAGQIGSSWQRGGERERRKKETPGAAANCITFSSDEQIGSGPDCLQRTSSQRCLSSFMCLSSDTVETETDFRARAMWTEGGENKSESIFFSLNIENVL